VGEAVGEPLYAAGGQLDMQITKVYNIESFFTGLEWVGEGRGVRFGALLNCGRHLVTT